MASVDVILLFNSLIETVAMIRHALVNFPASKIADIEVTLMPKSELVAKLLVENASVILRLVKIKAIKVQWKPEPSIKGIETITIRIESPYLTQKKHCK